MIKFNSRLNMKFDFRDINLSDEFKSAGEIVAQEIRGSIKRGESSADNVSFMPNAPSTTRAKRSAGREAKPLVDKGKTLISKGSYKITHSKDKATITLTERTHPEGKASIAEIGAWNHNGTKNIPSRPFFGITDTAKKRIIEMIRKKISEVIRGR